jgi:5-methylcytosine-specific restriction endonuclease McrA
VKRSAPIRRTRIRYKAKQHKESWRSGKVRLSGEEMNSLRCDVFARSRGYCEGMRPLGNPPGFRYRCNMPIEWDWFHLHHIVHLSLGGSDEISNVLALCTTCHSAAHGIRVASGKPQWSKKETV